MTLNSFLRSSAGRSEELTDELGHLGESADLWDDDVVVRAVLWEALRELPPHHRAALVLRYYEDLSEPAAVRPVTGDVTEFGRRPSIALVA